MKKIKVLQLGNCGAMYGAERWILALVKHCNSEKVDSVVASVIDDPALDAPLCRQAEELGFKTAVFEDHGKFCLRAARELKKFIVENDIDIIHTHHFKTDFIGLLATAGTRCRTISTPHGWSQENDIKLRCYEALGRLLFSFFDRVVPLSEDLFMPLRRNPILRGKLQLITNGVDIDEVEKAPALSKCNDKASDGLFVIGYIGQLISRKGLDVLLRACSKLDLPAWKLVLIGDGEQRSSLEHLSRSLQISGSVEFLGFRPDRLSLLKSFNCFVLPSKLEGIPRCLMEALSAGVPVIASDIPGCRDLVTHNETGLLFERDNHEQLCSRIHELAMDTQLQNRLMSNGRKLIAEKFSARRMAEKYEDLFMTLASNI
ncbi:MAG: glycosyltransferase [Thermodesulfobacteriota bacterium]